MSLKEDKMKLSTIDRFFPANVKDTMIGFDRIFEQFDQAANAVKNAVGNWPPYNIVKVDDNTYRLEFALAGYAKQDVEITMSNGRLTIRGSLKSDDSPKQTDQADWAYPYYICRGIANRAFDRTFSIADSVEIKNAEMINGMLRIILENVTPEENKVKKIDIK